MRMQVLMVESCVNHKTDPGRPALPASFYSPDSVKRGEVRTSRMGKRRAFVLIAIHVVAFAHILQWRLHGKTLSPVEPS